MFETMRLVTTLFGLVSFIPVTAAAECTEDEVSITGDEVLVVGDERLVFDGRVSAVVCESEAKRLRVADLSALRREIVKIVTAKRFAATDICPPDGSESALPEERLEMVSRLNAVLGRRAIRRVGCAFGWGFFVEGNPVSGLEARGSWVHEPYWQSEGPPEIPDFSSSFHVHDVVTRIDELIDAVDHLPVELREPYKLPSPLPSRRTLNGIRLVYTQTDQSMRQIHNLSMSRRGPMGERAAQILFALFARRAGLSVPSEILRSRNGVFHADWDVAPDAIPQRQARAAAARRHDPGTAFTEAFVSGPYSSRVREMVVDPAPSGS